MCAFNWVLQSSTPPSSTFHPPPRRDAHPSLIVHPRRITIQEPRRTWHKSVAAIRRLFWQLGLIQIQRSALSPHFIPPPDAMSRSLVYVSRLLLEGRPQSIVSRLSAHKPSNICNIVSSRSDVQRNVEVDGQLLDNLPPFRQGIILSRDLETCNHPDLTVEWR